MKKPYLLFTVAALAVAALGSIAPSAHAQADPFTVETVTTSTNAVAAATTAVVTTDTLTVRGSEGIGFVATTKLSGTGTAGVTFSFNVSADGETWTTTTPFASPATAANGTNSVVSFFNFSPTDSTELRNIRYIRLGTVQNANTPSTLTIESLQSTKYNR